MKKSHSLLSAFGLTAMLFVGAACSGDDAANDALKDAGVDANINTEGGLPAGFPEAVPTPDLKLETGVNTAGVSVLRYTSKDAKADVDAYKAQLVAAGFTIAGEVDNLAQANGNIAFIATSAAFTVNVSGFNSGGGYIGVSVSPS